MQKLWLGLMLMWTIAVARAEEPQNAHAFLLSALKKEHADITKTYVHSFLTDFYRDGLVGLTYLQITEALPVNQLEALHHQIKTAKVYPVQFQLCSLDTDNTCSDDVAFASKNYPESGVILVDARDQSGRYQQMSTAQKRRHALHEFAGLAKLELSNHHLSTQIDDADLYASFTTKEQRKNYFKFLGSLFNALPEFPIRALLDTKWIKHSIIQQNAHLTVDPRNFKKGEKLHLHIYEATNAWSDTWGGTPLIYLDYIDYKRLYALPLNGYRENYHFRSGDDQLEVYSYHFNHEDPWLAKKKNRKFKELFGSVPHKGEKTPTFKCKMLSTDELMCRLLTLSYSLNPLDSWYWTFEYAIYHRTTIDSENLRFK